MASAAKSLQLESRNTRESCMRLSIRCSAGSNSLAVRGVFGHDRAVSALPLGTSAPWERLRRM